MATRYTQTFSLKDLFNDKRLKNVLPLINYKETEKEDGKISATTRMKTVGKQIYDLSRSAARPYYKPLKSSKSGDTIILGGTLIADHCEAVDAVYNALKGQTQLLSFTVNNADMIRSALKEAEKTRRRRGINSKLYLRAQSIEEIRGMSHYQLRALMTNIMENIFFGDDFPETQKKYKVTELDLGSSMTYEQLRTQWKKRVGIE